MLIEVPIAVNPDARKAVLETLAALAPPGQSFAVRLDREPGHLLLLGDSEEQLNALLDSLQRTLALELDIGAPHVAYRETLSRAARIRHTYAKQSGPNPAFAEVTIEFKPLPAGSGFVFENAADAAIPSHFVPAIEQALRAEKEIGPLAGFPLVDVQATLIDGKYHEIDSTPLAFDIAARAAFRKLDEEGIAVLLEPVMALEVAAPEEFTGSVIGDLLSRRGLLRGQEGIGTDLRIAALLPLAELFGYADALQSLCDGRARYTMRFDHYARVPHTGGDDDPTFRPAMGMRA